MYKIQAKRIWNRYIEVSNTHFETLQKYSLLSNLVGSTGIIDETILDKLKLNVRSLLESEAGKDSALLDLCLDVIYNQNMKAFGLKNLVDLYKQWNKKTRIFRTIRRRTNRGKFAISASCIDFRI